MAKVFAEVEEIELDNDYGTTTSGVCVTCSRCGHMTESFGTDTGSVKRCLAMLRDECPKDESNFYITQADPLC